MMRRPFELRVLEAAIKKYGAARQERMVIEECAELISAISHKHRGRPHNIPEEIADVQIMLEQLMMINGCRDEVYRIRLQKLDRLRERLGMKEDLYE